MIYNLFISGGTCKIHQWISDELAQKIRKILLTQQNVTMIYNLFISDFMKNTEYMSYEHVQKIHQNNFVDSAKSDSPSDVVQ